MTFEEEQYLEYNKKLDQLHIKREKEKFIKILTKDGYGPKLNNAEFFVKKTPSKWKILWTNIKKILNRL
jgi:hypothetical protein